MTIIKNFTPNVIFGRYILLFSLLLLGVIAKAQLDTKHYIAPLFGREDKGCHYLTLSTPQTTPFPVTVTDGSGNLITTLTVSNSASVTYSLGCLDTSRFLVTESQLNTPLNNEGYILSAAQPFYASVRVLAGSQAGFLTTKGEKAGLGTDFRVGFTYNNNGDAFRKANVFGILATENNTTVVIDDIRPGVIFRGTSASGSPLTTPSVTVTLNAGQSYVIAEFLDEAGATQNLNGGNGTHVTSDKPISVNVGTWLGGNAIVSGSPGNGRDIGIDQIVPIQSVGTEYVLIKGEGSDNEQTIVVADQNNTDVFLNGSSTPVATINAGDYYVINGTPYSAFDNLYVQTSHPVYMYQTSNGGNPTTYDNERQNGLNFLPPVGCSGGKSVVLPNVAFIGSAYINIIADAGANVYVNGVLLPAGDPVTGTTSYETHKLTSGYTGDVTITSDKLIRVALINLNGNVGASGYFSGFTKDVTVQTQTVNGDNIALEGCIPASFTFGIDAPSSTPTVLTYTVGGTATNGIDYSYLDNSVTIPAGQTQASVIIDAISDGVPESQESIYIIYQPDLCSPLDTAYLYINDADPIEFTLDGNSLNCYNDHSGSILVNATGGYTPYSYHVTFPGGQLNQYSSSPITGLSAGSYTVQVYDVYGCKAEALVIGGVYDADTTFLPDGSGVTYTTQIPISGFDPGQTLTTMTQLQQICATMEHSYLGDLKIEVVSPSGQAVILKEQNGGGSCNLGIPFASGPVDGANSTLTNPGTGYEYCWNASPTYMTMVQQSASFQGTFPSSTGGNYNDYYLPQGSYTPYQNLNGLLGSTLNGNWTMKITDQYGLDNGYIFNWNISLLSDLPDTVVNVTQPDSIGIVGYITQATCGQNNGAINVTVTGVNTPFTYMWSNGATTEDLTGIGAGTYTLHVTDTTGCSDSLTFNLNNVSSLSTSASITQVSCAGGSNGAINVTTIGGVQPYTFSWSNGANTEDLSGLQAGSYTLTVTGANGCIHSNTFAVGTIPGINISLQSSSNEYCGTQNGSIDINVNGGTGSYGYTWSNGAATQDLSSVQAGSYTVTVIDGNACSATANYSIVNDVSNCSSYCYTNITTNNVTDEACGNAQGAIDISVNNASQPYTVSWNTGVSTEDVSGLSAGVYTVTVHDANQCVVTQTINVNNNAGNLAINSVQISDENCGHDDGSINISPAGGVLPYTYLWNNNAVTQDLNNLSAGNYSVTLTDGNGCAITQSYTVVNNTGSLSESAIVFNEVCNNNAGAINLSVTGNTGALTYLWSNNATTQDLFNLSTGTYSVVITDANGCVLNSNTYTVTDLPGSLSITSVNITNEHCNNNQGAIDVSVSGGNAPYTYNWSNGTHTQDLSGLNSGTYSLTVIDNIGCSVSSTGNVVFDDPGNLQVQTDMVTDEICNNNNGSIYVVVSGGTAPYNYSWSDGSVNEDNISLSAGTYTLTVTDNGGCVYNYSAAVNNTSGTLQITNAVVTHSTCNLANGVINLSISGGANPISYAWNNSANTQDINALAPGNYSVVITDNNGCQVSTSATVNNNAGTLAYTYQATAEQCSNAAGSIDLTVSGGTFPYTYLWNTLASSEDLTSLGGGNYSCTITDGVGCVMTTSNIFIANNPGTLNVTQTHIDASCGNSNGSINLTTSGGTGSYAYTWSSGPTTEDISGLAAGTYIYTVEDASECTITDTVIILNTSGTLALLGVQVSDELCNNNAGAITLNVSGGINPITYSWSNSATTQNISGLNQGTYSCVISDAGGCSINTGNLTVANASGTLAVDNLVVVDASCGNSLGSVNMTISGGTSPYTYSWSTGATTEDIATGLSGGNYSCTITDAAGCSTQAFITIQNTSGTLAIVSGVVTPESCNNNNGAVNITVQGGNGSYTYSWSNGAATQDISLLDNGNYSVQVNDGAGCSINHSYTVLSTGANLSIPSAVVTDEICGNNGGAINITVQGGTSPFNYVWSNSTLFEDISSVSAGTYSVTVTDFYGCMTIASYTVNNNTNGLMLTNAVVTDENCGNGQGAVNISISGGVAPISYSWSNAQAAQDINALTAGTYSVVISDGNGCYINSPLYTVQNITGGFTAVVTDTTSEVCGDQTGAIDITVTGGTGSYTYNWSNGAVSQDLSGIHAGTYTLTVSDASACSFQLVTTVANVSGGFGISNVLLMNESCGDSSGYIDITISGGSSPYDIMWSTTDTIEDLFNLTSGNYVVTITDASGCMISQPYQIQNSSGTGMSATATTVNETCDMNNGSIMVNVTGGVAPLTYTWSGSQPDTCCSYTIDMQDSWGDGWNGALLNVSINGLSAGTFSATGTGSSASISVCNGDVISLSYTGGAFENENTYQVLDASGNIVFADGPNPVIGAVYTGTTACSVQPLNGTGLTNLGAGVYTLTITDDVGCSLSQSYTITNSFLFTNSGTTISATCGTCANGSVDITPSAGDGPYNYVWNNGFISQDLTNVLPGTYIVTITGISGCEVIDTFIVGNSVSLANSSAEAWYMQLSPNPATDLTTLHYNFAANTEVNVQIVNMLGELVYETPVTDRAGKLIIDTKTFANGMYFINATTPAMRKTTKLLISR